MNFYNNEKAESIEVNRLLANSLIKDVSTEDSEITLTLFKNLDSPWILTDGWRGVSYFITSEDIKKKLCE